MSEGLEIGDLEKNFFTLNPMKNMWVHPFMGQSNRLMAF
jgi:hypothetical protein